MQNMMDEGVPNLYAEVFLWTFCSNALRADNISKQIRKWLTTGLTARHAPMIQIPGARPPLLMSERQWRQPRESANQNPTEPPLVSPSVIACLAHCTESANPLPLDGPTLEALDLMLVDEALDYLVSQHGLESRIAENAKRLAQQGQDDLRLVLKGSRERSKWFGYDALSEQKIVTACMALRQLVRLLGVFTPSTKTFAKNSEGEETDLVEDLGWSFWFLHLAYWVKFTPLHVNTNRAWGLRKVIFQLLSWEESEIDLTSFNNTFRGLVRQHGIEAVLDHCVQEDWDGMEKSAEHGRSFLQQGASSFFDDAVAKLSHMEFSPRVVEFALSQLESSMWAAAQIDGTLSDSERRFCENASSSIREKHESYKKTAISQRLKLTRTIFQRYLPSSTISLVFPISN